MERQTHISKSRRRLVRALAVAVVLVAAAPGAAVNAAPQSRKAGSTSFVAGTYLSESCQEGATCTHTASADPSGVQAGASSVDRPTIVTQTEDSYGMGSGSRTLKLAAPAPALRLTYTWRTESARSTATAAGPEGRAVGRVFARGTILGCAGCEKTDDPTTGHGPMVVDSYARPGQTLSDEATPGEIVSHTFTVRGSGGTPVPVGRYTLRGSTLAYSYVGCTVVSGGCFPELIGHSGSASAEATMQLLDITAEVVG